MDIYKLLTAKEGETIDVGYDGEDWKALGATCPLALKIQEHISKLEPSVGLGQLIEVDSYNDQEKTEFECQYYVGVFHSGYNGGGGEKKWLLYLDNIKSIMKLFKDSWLICIENDCCDDVHDFLIAFRKKK